MGRLILLQVSASPHENGSGEKVCVFFHHHFAESVELMFLRINHLLDSLGKPAILKNRANACELTP